MLRVITTSIPKITLLALLVIFLSFSIGEAEHGFTITGRVMQVKDGDTVTISPEDGGSFFVCRLYGIDAPEVAHRSCGKGSQRYGDEASMELKHLVLGQTAQVTTMGQKTYQREVCIIKKGGQDINLAMVKRGYAWAYRRYLNRPYASEYIDAEQKARGNRRGLWKDRNPTPPWEFQSMMR